LTSSAPTYEKKLSHSASQNASTYQNNNNSNHNESQIENTTNMKNFGLGTFSSDVKNIPKAILPQPIPHKPRYNNNNNNNINNNIPSKVSNIDIISNQHLPEQPSSLNLHRKESNQQTPPSAFVEINTSPNGSQKVLKIFFFLKFPKFSGEFSYSSFYECVT
jgi:hypothetical protein